MKSIKLFFAIILSITFFSACEKDTDDSTSYFRTISFLGIQVNESSITPFSVCFDGGDNNGNIYTVFFSTSEKDIQNLIQYIKKQKQMIYDDEELYNISSNIRMHQIEHYTSSIYELNPNTQYFYTCMALYTNGYISLQTDIQSFKTAPKIKELVDIGTSVLWCGYNYMKDDSNNDFIKMTTPSLFYESELPILTNSTYRYPTKEELEEFINVCNEIYRDKEYNFSIFESKINGEKLYIPYTYWAEGRDYSAVSNPSLALFPSENGKYGLEYSQTDVNSWIQKWHIVGGSYFFNSSYYDVNNKLVENKECRGIRLVKDK